MIKMQVFYIFLEAGGGELVCSIKFLRQFFTQSQIFNPVEYRYMNGDVSKFYPYVHVEVLNIL